MNCSLYTRILFTVQFRLQTPPQSVTSIKVCIETDLAFDYFLLISIKSLQKYQRCKLCASRKNLIDCQKARSHGALFMNAIAIKKWVVWMSMILFIYGATVIITVTFVRAMSHMNGFHTHSM